jgi:hypothetical protein
MLTEGTERTGERNVDRRNRTGDPATVGYCCQFCKELLSAFQSALCRVNSTSGSRVLLEKPTGPLTAKKFPAFYIKRMFITAFTRARHQSLS